MSQLKREKERRREGGVWDYNKNGKNVIVGMTRSDEMSIIFSIGSGREDVDVGYEKVMNSTFVKNWVADTKTTKVPIPDKFIDVIDNYVNYVLGTQTMITDKQYLRTCFNMSTYFQDNDYCDYLLKQLFDGWDDLSPLVYDNDNITPELQWEILIHCPHDFLPETYIANNKFMREWMTVNRDKIVTTNHGKETYYINHDVKTPNKKHHAVNFSIINRDQDRMQTSMLFQQYASGHLSNDMKSAIQKTFNVKFGAEVRTVYYPTGEPKSITPIHTTDIDDKKTCVSESWYQNGKHEMRVNVINGKSHGLGQKWYSNGQLQSNHNYNHGKLYGPYEEWLEDGKLKSRGQYVLTQDGDSYITRRVEDTK